MPEAILDAVAVPEPEEVPLVAVAVPEVVPVREQDSPLTPCTACGRNIAKKAATCPNCGAPNEWVHPEIVRFYQALGEFDFPSSVEFSCEKFVLAGVDKGPSKNAVSLSNFLNGFGVIGDLGSVLALHTTQKWVDEWARKKIKAFRIDFTFSPASWSSTDDEYWPEVMKFFGVYRVKAKRRK